MATSRYRALDVVFKILLALLAVCFVGAALWTGPSPLGILRGTVGFALPARHGPFDSLLLAVGMMGAVGGSLMRGSPRGTARSRPRPVARRRSLPAWPT